MRYRLLDCAPVYFNEKEIGDAFHEARGAVPKVDIFVTSKLACLFHRAEHVEVRCVWIAQVQRCSNIH